jgi:hypothetical protein
LAKKFPFQRFLPNGYLFTLIPGTAVNPAWSRRQSGQHHRYPSGLFTPFFHAAFFAGDFY